MFLQIVRSPGIAHLSYVVGDGGEAAVVDPRLDIDVYLEAARNQDVRISTIYETHRNEDLVSGARALGEATGARILHGTALDFGYGEGAEEGHEERLGDLLLRVLHTPGHTDESISVALWDTGFDQGAVALFSGDALFIGDVGRTDFYPDRAEEVAGLLHDSIHEKLLPLGDQALVYPAHGAGSVCGDGMASREFSSLGHERRNNPMLQLDRDEFVQRKVKERHYKPPYFREMERLNQQGKESWDGAPRPTPVPPDELARRLEAGLVLVDVRSPEACAAVSVPDSIALPGSMLSAYGGWFLPYDRPLGLVVEDETQERAAVEQLVRMGYTRVEVRLGGGIGGWQTSGRPCRTIAAMSAESLRDRLAGAEGPTVLDVRKHGEFESGHVPGAVHCYLGHLPEWSGPDDATQPLVTFCGSGKRALVAASLLRRRGFTNVANCFGSMAAWRAIGGEVEGGS